MAAIALLPWLVFHWSLYHNLTGPMTVQTNSFFWSFGRAHAWAGILFSPTHGLFVYQPWLLLALAALWPGCKRYWSAAARADAPANTSCTERNPINGPPGWRLWAISAVALHLTVVSGWWCWWGGLCWGSRLASEAITLAALLCLGPLGLLLHSRAGRCVACAMAVASALLHVPSVWLHQDHWYDGMQATAQEANAWRWQSPPFLYPFTDVPK
ncbi:MAG TPA: hypothetical protein VFI31_29560 [Pirellulales bacterium]|nr:hypothetical protein [Pirellulales bacterium]